MVLQGEFPFLKEKNHRIALVGAGGKTTLLYALAEHFAGQGVRTLVTTTTHIFQPEDGRWARSPEEVKALWSQASYGVAGLKTGEGKLKSLPHQELAAYFELADIVLVEADGARRMPCKVPASHEPVIPDACDIVIGVMGMEAFGKPLEQVCFRKEEAVSLLKMKPEDTLGAQEMARILASEEGTRKNVGERDYYVVLNQCDSRERIQAGEEILRLLRNQEMVPGILTSFLQDKDVWRRDE